MSLLLLAVGGGALALGAEQGSWLLLVCGAGCALSGLGLALERDR